MRVKGDGDGLAAQGNEVAEHLAGGTGDGLAELAGLRRGRPEHRQFNTATWIQIWGSAAGTVGGLLHSHFECLV